MDPVVFLSLLVVLVVLSAVVIIEYSVQRRGWEALARRYGLALRGSFTRPVIEGSYGGLTVEVRLERLPGGNRNAVQTRYRVRVGALLPAGLSVTKEGIVDRVGKLFGDRDITVGHPVVDQELSIRGRDTVGVLRLMRIPKVAKAVLGTILAHPGVEVGQTLELCERGMAEALHVEAVLDALCRLARTLAAGQRTLTAEDGPVRTRTWA